MSQESTVVQLNPPALGSGSRTNQAYVRLRQDILAATLTPATKLKIDDLRARYDFGASPIREALSLLTSDGLVERIDQRGFRVAPVSEREFQDVLKTRCWLEEKALRDSVENGDAAWKDAVVLAYYRLSRAPKGEKGTDAAAAWEARHKEFHMALIAACGSEILLGFCDKLYDQNIRYRQLARPTDYAERDIDAEHKDILDAVVAGDADLAVDRTLSHYARTGAFLATAMGD